MENDDIDNAALDDHNNNTTSAPVARREHLLVAASNTYAAADVNRDVDANGDDSDDDVGNGANNEQEGPLQVVRPTVSSDCNNDGDGGGDDDDDVNEGTPQPRTFEQVFRMEREEKEEDDDVVVRGEDLLDRMPEDPPETVIAHIRGTDIHVPSAAITFLSFLRTFRSLHHSQSMNATGSTHRTRQRTRDGANYDFDDDNNEDGDATMHDVDADTDTDDDADDVNVAPLTPPLYLNVLRDILHQSIGLPSTSAMVEESHSHSNTTTSTMDLTKSFGIDMIHMYYHNAECQQFYHQIVQHPMELIPLMDLLLQQEYERLLAHIVRCSQNGTDHDEDNEDVHHRNADNRDIVEEDTRAAEQYGYARLTLDVDQMILPRIQVRPYNLKIVSNLRSLDPISMDTLICCKGMIVRCSSIIPDLKVAHFACTICGNAETVTIDRGRIAEPNRCPTCQTKGSYQLQHNRSIFADKQLIRLQETPDEVPAGQTPASVITFCYDTLVDSVVPGDKVEITGILRAQPIRPNPKISKIKSIYKTYIDVIHFSKISAGMPKALPTSAPVGVRTTNRHQPSASSSSSTATSSRNTSSQWTNERIEQLKQLSTDPDIYNKLVQSLAPSIWELDNCKKGILCMLFGGNTIRVKPKHRPLGPGGAMTTEGTTASPTPNSMSWLDDDNDDDNENGTPSGVVSNTTSTTGHGHSTKLNKRGDINILLCGDPGTSKSQLLSYVNKLCTRGIYTSGKGSSAVGLTASVVRDPETRDFALESGALVLSDLGICCIDEFDKMSDSTRSVLHEAMEQQTVSIAKAGIIATLHARTSVLASANPIESRYNPNRSVVDNIQLPPTLLSRFDLIYLILDAPNVEHDRRLAQHLVGLYYETPNVVEPPLDQALLRDYIEYARQNIHPEISDEAASQLIESYLEMRNPTGGASNGTRTISATARQLESLIRLSEALAKMRYSPVVTRNDAKEAIRLMKVATQAAATDPRTGKIDMDMITTGRSSNTREMEEQLDITLQELFRERRGSRMAVRDVTKQLNEINNAVVPHDDMVEGLRRMHADGIIQFNERTQTIFVRSSL